MMIRAVCTVGSAAAGVSVVLLLGLWHFQESLIFIPTLPGAEDRSPYANEKGWRKPTEWGIPYEDVFLETAPGQRVHGWLMKQPNSAERPTIVFFHGNAGNIGHRLMYYDLLYRKLKVNVFAASHRGFGLSSGSPSERALVNDGIQIIDWLRTKDDLKKDEIIAAGRSLGGAVAIAVAKERPQEVRGVILENTFWSMKQMAQAMFKPLRCVWFLDRLLRHPFNSGEKIKSIKRPIMFISGERDELVPPCQMRQLYDAADQSTYRLWLAVVDGCHNYTWNTDKKKYCEWISKFMKHVTDNELNAPVEMESQARRRVTKSHAPSVDLNSDLSTIDTDDRSSFVGSADPALPQRIEEVGYIGVSKAPLPCVERSIWEKLSSLVGKGSGSNKKEL